MTDYARRMKKDESCLQFIFDGETVRRGETAAMLDMEDGDILDVNEKVVTVIHWYLHGYRGCEKKVFMPPIKLNFQSVG